MPTKLRPTVVSCGVLLLLLCSGNSTHAQASSAPAACAQTEQPGKSWKQIPHSQKTQWNAAKLAEAQSYAASIHDSSFMVIDCEGVVEQWGDTAKQLTTFSVRKSLLSALYGIYSAEGVINVNETLAQAGVDDSPFPLTEQEKQARIVDLLRARSGIYHPAAFEVDSQRKLRPARGSHPPGTFWFYNNWDFNTLGAIFEKKTGLKLGQAFYEKVAKPIGMQDFHPDDVYYTGDLSVSRYPAFMFRMSARDLARFGLLYLNDGKWNGKTIIPADWVAKSSTTSEMVHAGKKPLGGYEYLWWVEFGGVHLGEATLPGEFSARGAGGHFVLIVPSRKLVIVNQYANEPATHDQADVLRAAQDPHAVFDEQLAHIVKLVLDAQPASSAH